LLERSRRECHPHRPRLDGKIFAFIDSISPLPKNTSAPQADGYVRKINRLVSAPRKSGLDAADQGWDDGNPGNATGEEDPTGHEAPAPDEVMLDREAPERDDDEWN
jgi:hypothetical protein